MKATDKELSLFSLPVIVSMLGYLVDVYDIAIFGILRIESLQELGLTPEEISIKGTWIINLQLIGMILGGFVFGILGDKWGRKNILFSSIFLYSLATFLNAFVQDIDQYMILRFVAGFGLAGELGAGITIMAETVKVKQRSYATSLITGVGLLGGSLAYIVFQLTSWRTALMIGGILGFLLLLARARFLDSHLFEQSKSNVAIAYRGSLKVLFGKWKTLKKYLYCLGVAIPIQFFYGFFIFFANEVGEALGITETIVVGKCVLWYFIGNAIGDLFSGPLSHYFKSRKKVILTCMMGLYTLMILIFIGVFSSAQAYYGLSLLSGIIAGYWALFLITTSESFGTDLRATATVSAPNLVRGVLILFFTAYQWMKESLDVLWTIKVLAIVCILIALTSWLHIKETFHRDLNFYEKD